MGNALEWRIEGMERGIPCLGEVDGDVADVGGEADDSEIDQSIPTTTAIESSTQEGRFTIWNYFHRSKYISY